tara:strand:- start:2089 stop:2739 length:651 start_codon:yes stop_codon:yes gene_type:complete
MTNVTEILKNKQGIFGLGFSFNNNLDLLNLVVLACFGIVIKLFFQENYSKLGNIGPSSTTIWGYGLTALSLFLMVFMSLYLNKKHSSHLENKDSVFAFIKNLIMTSTLPIILTLLIVVYIIMINFTYFIRINSNNVSDSYHVYSFFSSLLLIIQIGLIIKYMYELLNTNSSSDSSENSAKEKELVLIKSATYILSLVNFVFVLIIHILLAFFSTDG